jgi:hypothetical protein
MQQICTYNSACCIGLRPTHTISSMHLLFHSLGDCGEQGRHRCWLQLNSSKLFVWSILHLLSLEWCPSAWSSAVYPGLSHTPYNGIAVHNYHCMPLYTCVQHLWLVELSLQGCVRVTWLPYKKTTRGIVKSMQISFQSTILGEFSEDFQWAVGGSPTPLSLRIT